MKTYSAPWSASLVVMSAFASAVCVGASVVVFMTHRDTSAWAGWLPLAIILGGLLFTIRGYTITADALEVQRLLWTTRLPLAGLLSAQLQPGAMSRSLRLFGNGGLFSFTGWYRNASLGSYRAYVTDLNRTVVLRFADRAIVVSPGDPETFAQELEEHAKFFAAVARP